MKKSEITELEAKVLKNVRTEIYKMNKNLTTTKIRLERVNTPDKFRLFVENQDGSEEVIVTQSLTYVALVLVGMAKGITLGFEDVVEQMDGIMVSKGCKIGMWNDK